MTVVYTAQDKKHSFLRTSYFVLLHLLLIVEIKSLFYKLMVLHLRLLMITLYNIVKNILYFQPTGRCYEKEEKNMVFELKQQFETKYNSLTLGDRQLVDHILSMALGWGHAHICSSCLKKYLMMPLPEGVILMHKQLLLNEDYMVKKHVDDDEVCEIDSCYNEAEFDIKANE